MSGWTREREDMLEAWVAEGLIFRLIAERFAERGFVVTRNAVIGKAQRMGLTSFVPPGSRRASADAVRPRRGRPPKVKPVLVSSGPGALAAPAMPPSAPALEPAPIPAPATPAPVRRAAGAHPKLLWLIPPGGCHFPVSGEGAQTLFCADPALEGRPYCPHHHRVTHTPVTGPVRVFRDRSTARVRRSDMQGDLVDEMGEAA